jgi:hypothetical protein
MKEFKPFSHFAEIQKRMVELAERLDISTDQPEHKIWELIGKVLAHKEKEFSDYPFMPGYERLKGKGRRVSRVDRNVWLAADIEAHLLANPTLETTRAAILDMRSKGKLPVTTSVSTQEQSASKGKEILLAQRQLWEEQQLQRKADDAAMAKSAAETQHLRRRNNPTSGKL